MSLQALEFERVFDLMAAFHRESGLDALLARVTHEFLELSGASGFALLMRDDERGWRLRAHQGLDGGEAGLRLVDLPFDDGGGDADRADARRDHAGRWLPEPPVRLAIHRGARAIYRDPADDPRFIGDAALAERRPRSIVCMPLTAARETIGVVYLESALSPDVFTPESLRLVDVLSSQVAISLLKTTIVEQLEQASSAAPANCVSTRACSIRCSSSRR